MLFCDMLKKRDSRIKACRKAHVAKHNAAYTLVKAQVLDKHMMACQDLLQSAKDTSRANIGIGNGMAPNIAEINMIKCNFSVINIGNKMLYEYL